MSGVTRSPPDERLRDAAQSIEDVASETRSGDHLVKDRDQVADALFEASTALKKAALLFGDEDGGPE